MIRLDTVNRVLKLFLGSATTTNPLQVVVCYSDQTASTYNGATQLSNSNGTTPVTICSAPASGAVRDIDMLSVLNTDTVAANVTIELVDTSTPYQLIYVELQIGDKLTFTHGSGWQVVSDSGNIKYTVQSTGGVDSFNTRTGVVTLTSSDVTTALGYTPGTGSVTSVALTLPSIFSVSGSPITGAGTLTATFNSETANTFFAAPNGTTGTPTFRSIVAADIPALNYAPQTSGTSILYGNGSGGFSNVTIGSGISFSAGTLSATGSGGTVTSVGLSLPSIFTITGSPVTGSGTLTATLNSETANTFLAAPNGSSGTPTFRSIVNADLPTSGVTSGSYGSSSTIPVVTVNSQGIITSITTQATNAPSYQGTWNALTNTPTLTSSVGTQGYYYVVSVAGTTNLDGNAIWVVGDWAIFGNGKWERIPGSASESFTNLTTTNLTVSGLTGYMYANGAGAVTASTTIPTTALSGTVTNAQLANSTISGVSLGSNLFNLTAGTNISFSSGTTYNGSAAITINAASTMVYPGAGIPNSTGTAWGTSYTTTGSGSVVALATSPTLVTPILGTPQSGNFSTGTFTWPTFNQNTTGNAATATLATTATNLGGTTQYSIPYQGGSATTSYLSPGTSGSLLMTLGSVAAPIWVATTSLTVGTATNIAGGAAGSVPYQTGSGATSFLSLGTSGYVLTAGASAPQYTAQSSLSVGTATNVAGGAANKIVYNTGSGATGFITAPSSSGTYLEWNGSSFVWATPGGGGTVTSVAQSFTGGLISVSGSPITTSGTLALTVAGTSGGIPYFSSASTWASSAALTANALMIGGGAGAAPSTTTTGTGVLTALGNAVNTSGGIATSAVTTLSSLASVGTLTTGTWNASTIGVPYGGTGITSLTSQYIPYGNGTGALNSSSNLQFDGTNLLVGTSSTSGSFSNTSALLGGIFKTVSGVYASAPNNTTVTIATLPNVSQGIWIVTASLIASASQFNAVAIVTTQNSSSNSTTIVSAGGDPTISVSGLSLQANQAVGITYSITWSATRLV